MKYERLIRLMPKLLLLAAAADFIKQCLFVASSWHGSQYFTALSSNSDLYLQVLYGLLDRALGVVLYPFAWVVSSVTISLLLSIYDGGRIDHA